LSIQRAFWRGGLQGGRKKRRLVAGASGSEVTFELVGLEGYLVAEGIVVGGKGIPPAYQQLAD
jgi:hypothetical protein